MITDRDREIIKHLEKYKYCTIQQLSKMFFKEQQYSYNIARRRLNELKKEKYVKLHRDVDNNRNIFIYDEKSIKTPNLHRMIILDVLAEIKYQGFNIEKFEIEKEWMNGKIRSDAFVQFTVDNLGHDKGRRCYFFVEVQVSNNHHRLDKYDTLYESGEVQNYIQRDFFPRVLLIADRKFKDLVFKHTKVVQLDTKLSSFASVLI